VLNETNILSSILDIPVKPEPSFQVSRVEQNAGERFDHVFRGRVDSHRNEAAPAPSQKFEAKERPTPEHSDKKIRFQETKLLEILKINRTTRARSLRTVNGETQLH